MRALLLALLMLLAGVPAFAQEPAEPATPRSWESLSPEQHQLLHSFQGNWDSLPAEKQQALRSAWRNMSPEQRNQWRSMSPEQRRGALQGAMPHPNGRPGVRMAPRPAPRRSPR